MDMSKYKSMFISETQEHLQSMNQALITIEQDSADAAAIAEAFRNAHSIKGMAASMGFEPIRDIAHAMEDLMDDIRDGARIPEAESMDLLFKGLDILETMLEDVNQDRELSTAGIQLSQKIRKYRGEETQPPPPAPPEPAKPKPAEAAYETGESAPPKKKPRSKRPSVDFGAEIEFDFDLKPKSAPPAPSGPEVWPPRPDQDDKEFKDSKTETPESPAISPSEIEDAGGDSVLDAFGGAPPPSPSHDSAQTQVDHPPAPGAPSPPEAGAGDETPELEDSPVPEDSLSLSIDDAPALEEAPAPEPPASAEISLTVRVVLSHDTAAPGVRGLILFKRLGEVGEIVGSRPPSAEVKAGSFLSDPKGLAVEVDLAADTGRDEVVKVIEGMADVESYEVFAPAERAEPETAAAPEQAPAEPAPPAAAPEPAMDPFAQAQNLPQTVRVRTTALDQFINSLGEMIQVKSELREVAKRHPIASLIKGLDRFETLVREFYDQVMTIRMMPVESVVQRLPRVVRDLAKDDGKKVKFEVLGKDIELDRAILEHLSDPLIHLLRNCVSHGIETPEERARAGKPEEGQIVVEAYRQRDLVVIEVRDDGRGIDPFHLKETAVAKGLITQEEADQMSDEAAYQLIFTPGFSTAKVVGMVSGRGVGMDAVKNVVESIGGFVTLASQIGKGVTFSLHLPRTIAIVNVLLVRMAKETFAVPIAKVQKTVEILPHQVRSSQGKRFYIEKQELIPMRALHRSLNLPDPDKDGRGPIQALIVEVRKRKNALLVDELVGQEEAFIRPLGKPLEKISGLSGVTMLGDGRVVFVLDTMSLL